MKQIESTKDLEKTLINFKKNIKNTSWLIQKQEKMKNVLSKNLMRFSLKMHQLKTQSQDELMLFIHQIRI